MHLGWVMRSRFISLGADCQPVHHIQRLTKITTMMPFDWLTTPIASVRALIESAFRDMLAPERLLWDGVEGDWRVTDPKYGVSCNHHFKSRAPNEVKTVVAAFRRSGEALLELIEDPDPIIFVRKWHPVDAGAEASEIQCLHAFLTGMKPNSVTLFLHPEEAVDNVVDANFVRRFNPGIGEDWIGNVALYDENFAFARGICGDLFGDRGGL